MQHKKKLFGGLSLALAAVLTIGGSLAYFTDRESVTANGAAGSLQIHVDNNIDLSTEQWNPDNILDPGDKKSLSWTVYEDGNKSADIRTTISLISQIPLNTNANGQAEFEIYNVNDVEEKKDTNGNSLGYGPKDGAQPLQVRSISDDKTIITYKPTEYSLNGATMSGVDAENDIENAGSSKESNYVLIFRQDATNTFQDKPVTLNVLIEAKQHRNTQDKWGVLSNDKYTINKSLTEAGPTLDVVPQMSKTYTFTGFALDGKTELKLTKVGENGSYTATNYEIPVTNGVGTYTGKIQPGEYVVRIENDNHHNGASVSNITIELGKTTYDLTAGKPVWFTGIENLGYEQNMDPWDMSSTLWSDNNLTLTNGEYSIDVNTQTNGAANVYPGTYTGNWDVKDQSGKSVASVPVSVTVKEGDSDMYDLSNQLVLPTQDSDGNALVWRTLTVNMPNLNTNAQIWLQNGTDSNAENWTFDSNNKQQTFRIATGGTLGKNVKVTLLLNDGQSYTDGSGTHNGSNANPEVASQTVDLTGGDQTVTFDGTFSAS